MGCARGRERITSAETWSARGRSGGDALLIYSNSCAMLYLLIRKQLAATGEEWTVIAD